jgi:hypothetical protein
LRKRPAGRPQLAITYPTFQINILVDKDYIAAGRRYEFHHQVKPQRLIRAAFIL